MSASSAAVTGFCAAFEAPGMPEEPNERLMAALEAANAAIRSRSADAPHLFDMGTTLVACMVDGCELRWVSVGDSPLWLVRSGEIRRLNANHSVAGELAERVEAGEMTAADAAATPGRAMLYSALMGGRIEMVDISGGAAAAGTRRRGHDCVRRRGNLRPRRTRRHRQRRRTMRLQCWWTGSSPRSRIMRSTIRTTRR